MAKQKKTVRIKYVRSAVGRPRPQREVIRGLGFSRLNQVVEREDSPAVSGMIRKVSHLLEVLEGDKS
ncbi:MAG: 50S ribosomal protein L30 [Acidobacteriota bacterium]